MRRAVLTLLVALVLTVAPAAAFEKGVNADPFRGTTTIFPELRALGARFLVYSIAWADVAPTRPANPTDGADPAYRWETIDRAAREAARHGIEIVPQIGHTPRWANGGRDRQFYPSDARHYARFLIAMSRRYPRMRRWVIWGEPSNLGQWFPQGLAGAHQYAIQLDAAYSALKSVSRRNLVIGGNSYCCGLDDSGSTSTTVWISRLRLPGGRRPRLDLYGMNPYGSRPIDLSLGRVNARFMDLNDMDSLAEILDRAWPGRRLQIFIMEWGIPTEHGNRDWLFFTSRREQARRVGQALVAASRFPRIAALSNYLLYDQEPREDPSTGLAIGWSTGLRTAGGVRKPAWEAFRRAPG